VTRRPSAPPPLGSSALAAFRDALTADELRTLLAGAAEDRASSVLGAVIGDAVDLSILAHRTALLAWLRSWGCRHLRRSDTSRSSAALLRWWSRWSDALPAPTTSLVDLGADDLAAIGPAYSALASLRAAARASSNGEVAVAFGDTAAAKALFALRPRALPPWDEPIRLAFGRASHDGDLYVRYLAETADALRGGAVRFGLAVDDVPAALGRPSITPARLIDEYLWRRITRQAR
jgi:hypothetical protein